MNGWNDGRTALAADSPIQRTFTVPSSGTAATDVWAAGLEWQDCNTRRIPRAALSTGQSSIVARASNLKGLWGTTHDDVWVVGDYGHDSSLDGTTTTASFVGSSPSPA